MSDIERIRDRLASLRAERGWSLAEVAEHCGMSKSHVWEIEIGRQNNPTISMLRRLSDGFGVPIAAFLEDYYTPRLPSVALDIAERVTRAIHEAAETRLIGEPQP